MSFSKLNGDMRGGTVNTSKRENAKHIVFLSHAIGDHHSDNGLSSPLRSKGRLTEKQRKNKQVQGLLLRGITIVMSDVVVGKKVRRAFVLVFK